MCRFLMFMKNHTYILRNVAYLKNKTTSLNIYVYILTNY